MTSEDFCREGCSSTDREPIFDDESGQVFPLMVVLMALAAGAALLMAQLGAEAVRTARLQTAADAAALAGSSFGIDAAERVAASNGAKVVSRSYASEGAGGLVFEVEVSDDDDGRASAAAAAAASPPALPSAPQRQDAFERSLRPLLPSPLRQQPTNTLLSDVGSSFAPFRP